MTVLPNLKLENIDRCINYVNNFVLLNFIYKEKQTSQRLIHEYQYTSSHIHTQLKIPIGNNNH